MAQKEFQLVHRSADQSGGEGALSLDVLRLGAQAVEAVPGSAWWQCRWSLWRLVVKFGVFRFIPCGGGTTSGVDYGLNLWWHRRSQYTVSIYIFTFSSVE